MGINHGAKNKIMKSVLYEDGIKNIMKKNIDIEKVINEVNIMATDVQLSNLESFLKGSFWTIAAGVLIYVYSKKDIILMYTKMKMIEHNVKKLKSFNLENDIGALFQKADIEMMKCETELNEQKRISEKFVQAHVCMLNKVQMIMFGSIEMYIALLKKQGVTGVSVTNGFYDITSINSEVNKEFVVILHSIYKNFEDFLHIVYKFDPKAKINIIKKFNDELKSKYNGIDKKVVIGQPQKSLDNPVFKKADFIPLINKEKFNNYASSYSEKNNDRPRNTGDIKPRHDGGGEFRRNFGDRDRNRPR
jgi:hypothetical protein